MLALSGESTPDDDAKRSGVQRGSLESLAATANRLKDTLRQLETRRAAADTELSHLVDTIAMLTSDAHARDDVYRQIRGRLESGLQAPDMASLDTLLQAWAQKPTDLLIMVKLSERAVEIANIVRTQTELRALVDETSGAPPPRRS